MTFTFCSAAMVKSFMFAYRWMLQVEIQYSVFTLLVHSIRGNRVPSLNSFAFTVASFLVESLHHMIYSVKFCFLDMAPLPSQSSMD